MKNYKILLTSFQTWLPHQKSNSSDDLLAQIEKIDLQEKELIFLRNLPVDIKQASYLTIEKIKEIKPNLVICCGMAEKNSHLQLESMAFFENKHYQTKLNLELLTKNLTLTKISNNAGKFVCEGLYFHVLEYLENFENTKGLFIHVPILNKDNSPIIIQDFVKILNLLM
jgi:pyroglutamyl-peptidase